MGTYQSFAKQITGHSAVTNELDDLLLRISFQDQTALNILHRKLHQKLHHLAMRLLSDADDCEDVVQDTFIQIWQNAGEYRPGVGSPMAWISSLLRNRAFDFMRVKRRHGISQNNLLLVVADQEETSEIATDKLLRAELKNLLAESMNALDNTRQLTVLMAYFYGYNRSDIAAHLQVPINTVKSRLKRSLSELEHALHNHQIAAHDLEIFQPL
jgi:RNA polymerase sigma-70 factor (ECF subfamily)